MSSSVNKGLEGRLQHAAGGNMMTWMGRWVVCVFILVCMSVPVALSEEPDGLKALRAERTRLQALSDDLIRQIQASGDQARGVRKDLMRAAKRQHERPDSASVDEETAALIDRLNALETEVGELRAQLDTRLKTLDYYKEAQAQVEGANARLKQMTPARGALAKERGQALKDLQEIEKKIAAMEAEQAAAEE